MPKIFKCSACDQQHKRHVRENCQFIKEVDSEIDSNIIGATGQGDMNKDILAALTSVSARLSDIETRISRTEDKLQQNSPCVVSPSEERSVKSTTPRRRIHSSSEDDVLIPSITALKETEDCKPK